MQSFRIVTAAVVLFSVAFVAVVYVTVVAPLKQVFGPATPVTARVEMRASEPDAVILSSFVTGDVPRILRRNALETFSDELWFTNNFDARNVVGGFFVAMAGMPTSTHIGTAFIDGITSEKFLCLTVGCRGWPTNSPHMWGLGPLQEMGDALGPEVKLMSQTFTDYNAYLEAHGRVMADPLLWFAEEGAWIPDPDTDGLRLVVVTLPTRVLSVTGAESIRPENRAFGDELVALSDALVEGLGGEIEAVYGASSWPLWVSKDGTLLRAPDNSTQSLPGYVGHNPVFRFKLSEDAIPILRARLSEVSFPGPDLSVIDPAVAAAFVAWGINTECLPGCGGIIPAQEFQFRVDISTAPPPFWTISAWRVPPPT